MKILLINPPYIGWFSDIKVEPLGILYIASFLQKHGHEVKLYDAYIGEKKEKFEHIVTDWKPDIVGCSVYTVNLKFCYNIAKLVKHIDPNILFIAGGPHATFTSKEMLKDCRFIDIVINHEGEIQMLQIVRSLIDKTGFEHICGITYRNNDIIIKNKNVKSECDIDSLPFPAKDLLSPTYYKKYRATGIISSRGCPYKCDFCVSPKFFHSVKLRAIKYASEEVKYCKDILDIKHIRFYDDVFAINLKRMKEVLELIGPMGLSWDCYIRVELINSEMLQVMREAGCVQVRFGVETGDYAFRKKCKGVAPTNEQYFACVEKCKKLGIETFPSYIIGFPHETKQDILKTVEFADRLNTDLVGFYKLTPYPGTIYYEMLDHNRISYEDYTKLSNNISVCKNLDSDALTELLYFAYNKYYKYRLLPNDPDALRFLIRVSAVQMPI